MKNMLVALAVMLGLAFASTVHAAELHGIVTDISGKPAAVKVILKDANGAPVGQPAATDKTGTYSFKDIKPGNYRVSINDKNEWKIFVGPGETRRDFALK
jgi:hypothetical protein